MATLSQDVTIRNLSGSLHDPETYLCGVLGNMYAWARKKTGQCTVT